MEEKPTSTWPWAAAVPQTDLWELISVPQWLPLWRSLFLSLFWSMIPSILQLGMGQVTGKADPCAKPSSSCFPQFWLLCAVADRKCHVIQAQNFVITLIFSFYFPGADLCFTYFKLRKVWKNALHKAILVIRNTLCCKDTLQFWKLLLLSGIWNLSEK